VKKLTLSAVICVGSYAIFWLQNHNARIVGTTMEFFTTCRQDEITSFPCFALYDLMFILVISLVGFLALLYFIFCVYKLAIKKF
jgi:hypothetical protein